MEGQMERFGWSLIDSSGDSASCLLFKTEKAADKYKTEMNGHHAEGKYELVELFVKKEG